MAQPVADTLVVGAGVVGQMLAHSLVARGQRVTLAHDPAVPGASRVAAWMINPVTGIRFVPSWRIEEFLPHALARYRRMEAGTGLSLWHPRRIYRLFQGEDEIPRWEKKRHRPEITQWLEGEFAGDPGIEGVRHTLGGLIFQGGGWVNLRPWLEHGLDHPPPGLRIVEIEKNGPLPAHERVIFCTGYGAAGLPWKPAKGEILTVQIPGLRLKDILLRGIFVIPLGENLFRVGATYEWDDLTLQPTAAGRAWLEEKLSALITLPYTVVDIQAGIRPILQDARPVARMLDARTGVCNGFGSKAALMAPWLTDHFPLEG